MGTFLKNTQSKKPKKTGLLRVLIVIGVGMFIGVVGYGVYRYNAMLQKVVEEKDTVKQQTLRADELYEKARKAQDAGDYEGAKKLYDNAYKGAKTNEDKAEPYLAKSMLALNAQKYDEALGYARQAEVIWASERVSRTIIAVAQTRNDNKLVLEYSKKLLGQLDTASPTYQSDLATLKNDIARLEARQ